MKSFKIPSTHTNRFDRRFNVSHLSISISNKFQSRGDEFPCLKPTEKTLRNFGKNRIYFQFKLKFQET